MSPQIERQSIDQNRFARAGGTGHSHPMRAAGGRVQLGYHFLAFLGIIFYEGEKTGECKPVTGSYSLGELQALSPLQEQG